LGALQGEIPIVFLAGCGVRTLETHCSQISKELSCWCFSLPMPADAGKRGVEGSLARLTGCFAPNYEFHNWSNVVGGPVPPAPYRHYRPAECKCGKLLQASCPCTSACVPLPSVSANHWPSACLPACPPPHHTCLQVWGWRDHLLYPHMERMSTRYARYAGVYYQDDLARGGSSSTASAAGTASAWRQTAR
jgi:hypothetical protein